MTEATEPEDTATNTAGTMLYQGGRYGIQIVATKGGRWSDEAEAIFFNQLAATCNVELSARACGFSAQAVYRRRRKDPVFHRRWEATIKQGYAALEMLLVRRAIEALEGFAPDPGAAVIVPEVSVQDALAILGHHRRMIEGGPRSRRQWAKPKSLDEMNEEILKRLEAIAPSPREEERASPLTGRI